MINNVTWQDFEKILICNGKILKAEIFERTKKPAYKIWADFGPIHGVKQSSAQITHHYTIENLIGKTILGCLNLGPKNIAGFRSEFLLLGFHDQEGNVHIATTANEVPLGQKLC